MRLVFALELRSIQAEESPLMMIWYQGGIRVLVLTAAEAVFLILVLTSSQTEHSELSLRSCKAKTVAPVLKARSEKVSALELRSNET